MIKIENLTYGYSKENTLINDLNLEIKKGTYTCILGPNGSGKSTLAKLITGLLTPLSGKIFVNGNEVKEENFSQIRKDCFLVFQNPDNQFVGATVEDDIAFGLENRCVKTEEMHNLVLEYATKVGMQDFLKNEPGYLSGGQKQRVAIAGALVVKPKVLILDEATSMLDPKGRKDILNLVDDLRKEDKDLAVVFITHDVDEAMKADEIVVLNSGQVTFQGQPHELFSNYEFCKENNLHLPFGYEIQTLLKNNGLDVKSTNLEDLVEELCQ